MAAETGFFIEGEVCEMVILDDFDTDERFILHRYSELVQEDFLREDGETDDDCAKRRVKLMRRPGFWPAMWHVAYRRVHPDADTDEIKTIIGRTKFSEAMSTLAGVDDTEELDPTKASTNEPEQLSPTSLSDSPASSGAPSENDTAPQEDQPAPTTDGSSPPSESTRRLSAV